MTIKVTHIITGLGSGGAEAMLMKLVSALDPREFKSSVISLTDEGKYGPLLRQAGIEVHGIDMRNKRRSLAAPFRLRRLINDMKPDIVQGWMAHGNLAALYPSLPFVHKAPVIWNIRQSLNNFAHIPRGTRAIIELNARLSKLPRKIIYNSRIGASEHEAIGYDPTRSLIIPNGFDTDIFRPNPAARATFLKAHGLPDESLLVGLVGRWDPLKDHPAFIRMSRAIARRHDSVHFVLAGQNMDPANADLVALVEQQGVPQRTLLLGEVSNTADLMAALDIFVLCSIAEGFPNVVGEAMASGVPGVVTDAGECRAIIGDSGPVITVGDIEALITAVEDLITRGPDFRREMGARARTRIQEHYSLQTVCARYETLYRAVQGGSLATEAL